MSKRFFIGTLTIAGAMSFSMCSDDPWTETEKDEFITDCMKDADDRSYCNCYLQEMMDSYPQAEDAKALSFEQAVEISEKCE